MSIGTGQPVPRKRMNRPAMMLALLLVFNAVGIGVLLFRGDDAPQPSAIQPAPTVTATATATITAAPDPEPTASVLGRQFPPRPPQNEQPVTQPPPATDTGTDTRTDPPPAPDPAPKSVCSNSHDASCGPVRWSPKPGSNASLSMDAGFEPNAPVVGQTVTFTVDATDPDARVICCDVAIDGKRLSNTHRCANKRYGTWDTPAKKAGAVTYTFEHTFSESGTHTVQFFAVTGSTCAHPYKNTGSITLEFVVFSS